MIVKFERLNPPLDLLREINVSTNLIIPDQPELKLWYDGYAKQHSHRLAHDLNYLISEFQEPKEISILELGAAPFILTTAIKNRGYSVIGLDIAPERFNKSIIANKLQISKGTLGNMSLSFKDETFDVVILNEVFEHLNTNLIDVFDELIRVMKTGGKLFLSTPNLKSMVGIRNFLFRDKSYSCCGEIYEEHLKLKQYGHMGHVREYTVKEVSSFLAKMGLEIDIVVYRGKYPTKYRIIDWIFPKLKPFFSIIAIKKA